MADTSAQAAALYRTRVRLILRPLRARRICPSVRPRACSAAGRRRRRF